MIITRCHIVSTDRQEHSGLGLDPQRAAVASYIDGRAEILTEFTEVESGRKNGRLQLLAALALCCQEKVRLIITQLDRLARNAAFIAN